MDKPLKGIKILDFTQFFAGPLATLMLSDMGADVIKLENPPLGDATRYSNVIQSDKSTNYTSRNRGKKSVLMNLKDERQRAIFFEMVKDADAVIENFRPGTIEKYGVTYEKLRSINPRIVFTSISGYGQYGPYRTHGAFDGAVQAESGIMSITGEMHGHPIKCGASIADATAGLVGCIGTLGALLDAKRTGKGRWVDVSMMDSIVSIMENYISSYMATGVVPVPIGNRMWTACPFNSFTCKDGVSVFISITTDAQFEKFCRIVNRKEWINDCRFKTLALRSANADILEPLVQAVLDGIKADELCRQMEKHNLVYGRINTVKDVCEHPQIKARNMIVNATYPDGTRFRVPGCPIKMSGIEETSDLKAMTIGYNTFEILSEYCDKGVLHEIYDPVLQGCREAETSQYHPTVENLHDIASADSYSKNKTK